MISEQKSARLVRSLGLLLAACWLIFVGVKNEIPADPGDGVMHFFYAQASWQDPSLFLHHWGKPFFILLSSGFAQFGFTGIIVFNVLAFIGTVWFGYKILDHFGCNKWLQGILPGMLVLANDYTTTIVGGLTEPLFNLALVLATYLFIKEKYVWFAILISFMPFMRSEGQLPVLIAVLLLTWKRSYKSMPFLVTGFLLYAIAGVCASRSFWWFFTESPYQMANDIYGKGTWDHYLTSYKFYLGNPGLYAFMLGTISGLILIFKKQWQVLKPLEAFLGYGVFFGVIAAHSYFWATGQNGSLGLTRIATQGMPLFVIFQLYYVDQLPRLKPRFKKVFALGTVALLLSMFTSKHFPIKAGNMEREVMQAATFLKEKTPAKYKVHYHYPLLVYAYGENPFKKGNRLAHSYFHNLGDRIDREILPGEFIVWDSHFGPREAGLPLDTLKNYEEFVKVKEFVFIETNGSPEGVIIYQYIPFSKHQDPKSKAIELEPRTLSLSDRAEFKPIIERKMPAGKSFDIQLKLHTDTPDLLLVYDYDKSTIYQANELKKGVSQEFNFRWPAEGETNLYIWNPKKKGGSVQIEKITIREQMFHPVMK
jgi:hypothetical protein